MLKRILVELLIGAGILTAPVLIYFAWSTNMLARSTHYDTSLTPFRDTEVLVNMPATYTTTVCCDGLATTITTTGTITTHRAAVKDANDDCVATGGTTECP